MSGKHTAGYHREYRRKNPKRMRAIAGRYRLSVRGRRTRMRWVRRNRDRFRRYALKRRYNITPEQYEGMLKRQRNKCPICRRKLKKIEGRGRPHIDHNHVTGEVRGVLCIRCNLALAWYEQNAPRVEPYLQGEL